MAKEVCSCRGTDPIDAAVRSLEEHQIVVAAALAPGVVALAVLARRADGMPLDGA